jgi:predicted alpha/beta hydrolase family esterase
MPPTKVIFLPGNGGGGPHDNWFPYLQVELGSLGLQVIAEEFPDNVLARQSYWLPFLQELGADENTILIGHSSGAIAAMRYAEQTRILGSVLVGAYHTDLGLDSEKQSGYFDKPWDFSSIKNNQQWIGIFAGKDDPWIPVHEARHLNDRLDAYYFEFPKAGHFGGDYLKLRFPEVVTFISERISTL